MKREEMTVGLEVAFARGSFICRGVILELDTQWVFHPPSWRYKQEVDPHSTRVALAEFDRSSWQPQVRDHRAILCPWADYKACLEAKA